MLFTRTFTFKTRRRSQILAFLLMIVSHTYASNFSLPCPQLCSCYNSERGISASCANNILWNGTAYPDIHELVMRPTRPGDECYIPEDASKVFPRLLSFKLSNCSLSFILSDSFKNLKSVDTIDLSNNYIHDFSPRVFAKNRKLRYVNLQNNPLNLTATPLLESTSLWELNLDSCNIEKISRHMFKGMPELKYLTLSNNKIRYLKDDSLPSRLRTLNLANNNISNVPMEELIRLRFLTEINLSGNPINCTCQLMGFQNWDSGKGVIFVNVIKCAYPEKYAGRSLINISQFEMCDAKVENESTSAEHCAPNQICSNQILPTDDGYVGDQPNSMNDNRDETFVNDQVIPVDQTALSSTSLDEFDGSGDGSGDGGSEDKPDISDVGSSNNGTASIPPSSPTSSSENTPSASTGVEKYNDELITPASSSRDDALAANTTQSPTAEMTPEMQPLDTNDTKTSDESPILPQTTNGIIESSSSTEATDTVSAMTNETTATSTGNATPESPVTDVSDVASNPPASSSSSAESIPATITVSAMINETTASSTSNATPESPVTDVSDVASNPLTSSSSTTESIPPTVTQSSVGSESSTSTETSSSTATSSVVANSDSNIGSSSSEIPITVSPASVDSSTLDAGNTVSSVGDKTTSATSVEGNHRLQEKLQNNSDPVKKDEMLSYIIPGLAIGLVLLISLAVYCSQYASKHKWKKDNADGNGSELQDISLLGDKPPPTVVKHSNKYPDEKTCQTERLMSEDDQTMKPSLREVNANDDRHSSETMDCCKLPNGQSESQNVPEKVECTIVKVTTLPDSVPKTPIIKNV